MKLQAISKSAMAVFLALNLAGCTFILQHGRRSDVEKIEDLSQQLDELSQAKKLLEDRLSQEISNKQVKLEMMEKGLVITFVADILFSSGKDKIKSEAYTILNKVAKVLNENVPELNIGVEGHTDNIPIKVSNWKSNWELSSARALSVLHYLVEEKDVDPSRVSAVGYGEYRPVASNDTINGRQENRRVEIVILPKIVKAKQAKQIAESPRFNESEDNLK